VFWSAYPFVRFVGWLVLGILLYAWTDWYHAALLLVPLMGCAVLLRYPRPAGGWRPVAAGLAAGTSLVIGGWTLAYQRAGKNNPAHLLYAPDSIRAYRGVVVRAVEDRPRSLRTTLRVEAIRTPAGWQPRTGRVQVYLDRAVHPRLQYGDAVLVSGTPEPVAGPRNPGELDYRTYLARRAIYHTQYLGPGQVRVLGHRPPNPLTAWALRTNRHVDSLLTHHLADRREYAVVNAMLLGVRDDLDPALLRAYAASGAIHVLSISGMHVGIFYVALLLLVGLYRRYVGWVSPGVETILTLGLVWTYALVTGLSIPVLRSATMLSILAIGRSFRRQAPGLNTLAISAFVLLCAEPGALFQVGFQLSFAAVAGLIVLQPSLARWYQPRRKPQRWLWQALTAAGAAQLATFPLSVYYFHQFPVYFLVLSPVVLALASLLLYGGMAFVLLGTWSTAAAEWLGQALRRLAWLLNEVVLRTEQWPAAIWTPLSLTLLEVMALYALLISGIVWIRRPRKALGYLAAGLVVCLGLSGAWGKIQQRRQRTLVVHHLGREHTGTSLLAGRRLTLLADSTLRARPNEARYQWGTFQARAGVRRLDTAGTALARRRYPFGELLIWQGRRIVWLNQPGRYPILTRIPPADLLLLSHNAQRYPDALLPRLRVRQIVIDATNSRATAARWQQAARQHGVPVHVVAEAGAFVQSF
jgi:competence protein ComEC